jgi:nucleotide-binding universal stress UspA family protein
VTPFETSQGLFWHTAIPLYLRTEVEDTRIAQARLYLAGVAERLRSAGLRAEFEVLPADDEAEAIIARADRDVHIGLLAMATHGSSGARRRLLGSVTVKMLQAVATPFLLVRAAEQASSDTAPVDGVIYRTIIVPLDGSAFAEAALDEARRIASATGARLVLLTVVPAQMDKATAEAERAGAAAYHASGAPAEQILAAGDQQCADLIVMATHGRGGWRELWLGSTANKVVHSMDRPVLLVRPRL